MISERALGSHEIEGWLVEADVDIVELRRSPSRTDANRKLSPLREMSLVAQPNLPKVGALISQHVKSVNGENAERAGLERQLQ